VPVEVRAGEADAELVVAALGRAALLVTFALVAYALVAGGYAAWRKRRRLALSAQNALIAAFASTIVAAVVLWTALGRRDFTFAYVSDHISRKLPLGYALSAFWGGQEGSLLLWLLILTGYAALAVWLNRRTTDLVPWVVPVLGGVGVFFAFMLCFVSSPFTTQPAPADGAGMQPSLQNPYMLAHPPMLYLGYVGLTIPFAFAMGALLSGRTDERWIVLTRRWTLAAWTFLGVGQLLGAHWAYVEIGWGGYYAWDPVENAAFMPWLAATAFLHSVMIQEKRGMLKVWNMVLVALAFCLSIFGTFLTRSGVINSIHSFSQSPLGGWFLGFIAIVTAFSVLMIYLRLPLLRARTKLESLVSREATFLYNNLLLVAFCLTILWGVVYPLLTQALRGETRSVSKPYYNFFLHSFGLPLLLLMGIGPLIAWRRASLRSLGRMFVLPFAAAVVTGAILLALGFGSSLPGLLAYTFSVFVAVSILLEFVRGRRATGSIVRLVARNRRRYGGYLVHVAVLLFAIGIAGSSAYQTVREQGLRPGQSMQVAGYTLTYQRLDQTQEPNHLATRAVVDVSRGSSHIATLDPGKNTYPVEKMTTNEVSIYHDPRTIGDVFLIADQVDKNGTLYLKALVKPLVNLLWIAGVIFVFGSLVALWPDAVEQRRLAERYAAAPA
jgi:cytochrome c-type biogenesis protein CcmF